ncbi:hypothetical protein LSUE1_G007458 [Lachnellula suecica]|uniref:Uncharacterized protein n=1 Tax=Lachnellula suecica TaxID=602035 RepID=A0A8T9BXI3_9HELO|nr:hypothetical protein LSUE1_G007458 [Lachnellula suecica]
MSLTVKHVNSDASFLLTFKPNLPFPPSSEQSDHSFTILLDPWISGSSKIFHSKFSISKHTAPACVASLAELPEPDVVVISQDKSDHCHKETLTQIPGHGGKTIILAEPVSAKQIKGWKHFDEEKLVTLSKWEDPRLRKASTVHRLPVPALSPGGLAGEVTIAYMAQKADITRLHSAIGITYRAPTFGLDTFPITPPASPASSTFSTATCERALSVIFSPHGCSYKTLSPYVTSHLVQEAALPLTALLHCFDRIQNSWYLGGNICAGFPGGLEIAQKLCARAWISAHDGDKVTTGIATTKIKVERYDREAVESVISPRSEKFPNRRTGTEAVVLDAGEDITLNQSMDFGPEE